MSVDYFSNLSQEILLRIFDLLTANELLICGQVCWQWYDATCDNLLWYKRCASIGITYGLSFQREPNFWKEKFIDHLRHCQKWRGNPPVPPAIVSMHNCAVISDLVIHNDWAACSLENGTIVVVDINSQIKKHTFRLNDRGAVWCLVPFSIRNEDYLASGGNDGIVRIWTISSGECATELENNEIKATSSDRSRMVRCLTVTESKCEDDSLLLVSGGRYFVLLVWDVSTKKCLHELHGHSGAIRTVKANKEIIVSASYDGSIKVWEVASGYLIHSLIEHSDRVYTVHLARDFIVSSSLDQTMKVWQVKSGLCVHTLAGHSSLTKDMAMDCDERLLVSGNADHTIKVWCLRSGRCLATLSGEKGHSNGVTSVQVVSNTFVVSSGADGLVKLWRLSDGSFIRDILNLEHFGGTNAMVWKMEATDRHLVCATGSTVNTLPSKLYLYNFSCPASK